MKKEQMEVGLDGNAYEIAVEKVLSALNRMACKYLLKVKIGGTPNGIDGPNNQELLIRLNS